MDEPNLQEIHDLLVDVALKAGTMITSAHPSHDGTDTKINSTDLVTATDKEVETMVSATLKERFSSYEFLGEETYTPGTPLTPAPTFICDPIDGTTNFVHGNPNVCISLGFTHHRHPRVGVVYNPFLRHLYHGIHGRGSYLTHVVVVAPTTTTTTTTPNADDHDNTVAPTPRTDTATPTPTLGPSHRLPLRSPPEPLRGLRHALLAHEWGNERAGPNWAVKTTTFLRLLGAGAGAGMAHGLRSTGSSALNICAVATGGLDAYWEGGCWAWDVAGAWCILEEAGGMMASANVGEVVRVDGRVYLAVRGVGVGVGDKDGVGAGEKGREMQRGFVEEVWGCVGGRLEYDL